MTKVSVVDTKISQTAVTRTSGPALTRTVNQYPGAAPVSVTAPPPTQTVSQYPVAAPASVTAPSPAARVPLPHKLL